MVGDRKPFAHVASPWQTSGVCIRVFEYQTPKRNETRAAFFPNFYTRMPFGGTSGDWSRRRCAEWGIFFQSSKGHGHPTLCGQIDGMFSADDGGTSNAEANLNMVGDGG